MNRVVDFSAIWTLSEMGWHWFWIENKQFGYPGAVGQACHANCIDLEDE